MRITSGSDGLQVISTVAGEAQRARIARDAPDLTAVHVIDHLHAAHPAASPPR